MATARSRLAARRSRGRISLRTPVRPHDSGRAPVVTWVVYETDVRRGPHGAKAVCEQSEWDAMELARPGYRTLLLNGIMSEADAEKLARGAAGDGPQRPARRM
jgi:hypothetical protein